MSAATTAQWLTSAAIGTTSGAVALGLLKLALDAPPLHLELPHRAPRTRPATTSPAPAAGARHAGPAALDETAALTCVHPSHARHSKGQPAWN